MTASIRCCSLLLFIGFSHTTLAQGADAIQWLIKMSRASQTLNYDGTFVYLHDNAVETMRVIHKADSQGEYERLISLNGTSREVIRNNDVVTCILPNSKRVVVDKNDKIRPFAFAFGEDAKVLAHYYDFTLDGADRIAGVNAKVIHIRPKDQFRYGYRLWLDEKSGLLLKSELIDNDGQTIEQMMFTSIEVLDTVPSGLLKPQIEGKDYVLIADEATDDMPIEKGWQFTWLPDGFKLGQHHKRRLSTTGTPVDHMVLSDGFTMVSVFIESIDEKRHGGGPSKKGAINAYTALIADHKVTAVGEVPAATVQRIANGMKYHPVTGITKANDD